MLEFKKTDKFVDGKCVEEFYINDKQTDESTYYSLFTDQFENLKNTDELVYINENTESYYEEIIQAIQREPKSGSEILHNECTYLYHMGYFMGQYDLTKGYGNEMMKNCGVIETRMNDLNKEYGKNL